MMTDIPSLIKQFDTLCNIVCRTVCGGLLALREAVWAFGLRVGVDGSPSRNKGGVWGAAAPQGANEPPQVASATASICEFRLCVRFCTARQES